MVDISSLIRTLMGGVNGGLATGNMGLNTRPVSYTGGFPGSFSAMGSMQPTPPYTGVLPANPDPSGLNTAAGPNPLPPMQGGPIPGGMATGGSPMMPGTGYTQPSSPFRGMDPAAIAAIVARMRGMSPMAGMSSGFYGQQTSFPTARPMSLAGLFNRGPAM